MENQDNLQKKNIKVKIFLLLILFLFIILFILFLYFWMQNLKNKEDLNLGGNNLVETSFEKEEKIKNNSSKSPYSSEYIKTKEALAEKNIEKCRELEDEHKISNCIYSLATQYKDKELCFQIEDSQLQEKCQEFFLYLQVLEDKNAEECLKLQFNNFKEACLNTIFQEKNNISYCANFSDLVRDKCENMYYKQKAIKEKDSAVCSQINDEGKMESCYHVLENTIADSDGDGLSDTMERSYGLNPHDSDTDSDGLDDSSEFNYKSDPKNPDTDGDGYLDGAEVEAGFSPIGE